MARTLVRGGIAVIACLAAVSAAACTAANPKNNNSKTPDTLHAVMSEEADNLNPLVATEQGKSQILSVIATPALYIDPNSKPASRVLASWSQSPDLKTVTLTLKPDVKWSDGQPMTATDIKFSLSVYLNEKISVNAGRVGPVVGEDAVTSGSAQTLSGVTTPDDRTVKIQLAEPDATWLNKFALLGTYAPVLPSHILGNVPQSQLTNNAYFKNWPVSSGPYKLAKFVQGQYVQVDRNDKYSFKKPVFPHVVFEILSTDQMTAKLQTGEVNYIYTVDPSDVSRVKAIPGVTVASHQGVAPELFAFNNGAPELKDPRIRQAMIYAIDRKGICQTVLAGHCATPTTNLRQIGPSWSIPTTGLTDYNYDPAKAKQLLAAAHWNPSTKLVFYARTQRSYVDKAVTVALGQLAAVGIHFTVRTLTTAQLLDQIKNKTGWDAFWISGADFVVDPDEWADYLLCDNRYPNGPNTSQFCDPKIDTLLKQGVTAPTQDARATLYHEAFTDMNQNPADAYLYIVDTIVAYDSHLKGIVPNGNLSAGYRDIENWTWQ